MNVGRLLCLIGLHRWKFYSATDFDAENTFVSIYAKCRRPDCDEPAHFCNRETVKNSLDQSARLPGDPHA